MGFKFVATDAAAAFTAGQLVYPDGLMSPGSLLLMDLGHSQGGFSGVPGNGAVLPNIAWQVAAGIIGSGTATTLAPGIIRLDNASVFILERTGKLGLHCTYTLTTDFGGNFKSFLISRPTLITNYKIANPTHHIYESIWYRVTRASNKTGDGRAFSEFDTNTTAPASNYFYTNRTGATYKSGGLAQTDVSPSKNTIGAPTFEAISHNAMTGTVTTSNVSDHIFTPTSGEPYSNWAGTNRNDGFSAIIYRAYSEDLTVSGRSYATVKAADKAMFDIAFGTGGKFNGDTFTAPTLA